VYLRAYFKYNHSLGGLERNRRYDCKRGWRKDYKRELYHRIQDEAGCHRTVQDFYPAFRFLKALENAGVVEIKV